MNDLATAELVPIPPERLGYGRAAPTSWVGSVFLPAQRVVAGAKEVAVELRHLVDGRLAVFAFTTLDALVDGCGPGQPWVAVDTTRVMAIQREAGADLVLWDVPLPEELRHHQETTR